MIHGRICASHRVAVDYRNVVIDGRRKGTHSVPTATTALLNASITWKKWNLELTFRLL